MQKNLGRFLAAVILMTLAISAVACQPATPAPTATSVPPTLAPTEVVSIDPAVQSTPTLIVLEGATVTDTGLQYVEIFPGDGNAPQVGDIVTLQYIATLPDGTELANSYIDSQPIITVWGRNNLLPGWEEGIGLMKVNGKARVVLPPELAFGAEGSGAVPPNSQILIEMELLSSEPAPVPTAVTADQLTKTASGLEYYDITVGDGDESALKSGVSTHYTMWLKTDSGYDFIDSSAGNVPLDFVLGRGDVVFPGWDEGATGMKIGGKRLLVIPPQLAMGDQGMGIIPPNSTLVMEIELMDVREALLPTTVDEKDFTTTESGLKYYDLTPGTGESPTVGQTVVVHYTGWLEDGTQFDSSIDSGQPFLFNLGTGGVIAGWDEGVATMKVGGKRQLVIPSDLGYGDTGAGGVIPPGATLIFEVELLEIQP